VDTLWILASITYIESTFEGDLLIVSMNRRNDYREENLFHCSYGHLTVVLTHTGNIVNPSLYESSPPEPGLISFLYVVIN